ncbi:hypothetical protein MMC22_003059 [Lobaria immixta]|nr:hypothetical protein [Lobaria immixta]
MIEDLGLDKGALAGEMAIALAIIRWEAKVDGMDVEFTKAPTNNSPPSEVHTLHFNERPIHFWVLDFDKATRIKLTANDVDKKLVPAFVGNDPYYPRPDVNEELWTEFSWIYLKASKLILDKKQGGSPVMMSLPTRFLAKVTEMIKENEDWDPEEQIVFGD